MPAALHTILFDAAGTLFSVREPVGTTYAQFARSHGLDLDPAAAETAFRTTWRSLAPPSYRGLASPEAREETDRRWWRDLVLEVFQRCGIAAADGFDPCFDALYAHYGTGDAWRLHDEAPAVLETVGRHCRLAVLSNFDRRLPGVLHDLGIDGWFHAVLTSCALGASKPDPAAFARAVEICGAPGPDSVLHVGDSPREDWEGAAAAGLRVFRLERPGRDLRELVRILGLPA